MARATSLLKAFKEESIPHEGAFIITSGFDPASQYSIYEITAYGALEKVLHAEDGFLFKADADCVYILVEPPDYPGKSVEPLSREPGRSIPLRFRDLEIITGKNNERIMISAKPRLMRSPFFVPYKKGEDFAFIFYLTADVYMAIRKFTADVLYNDSGLSREDAIEVSHRVLGVFNEFFHEGVGDLSDNPEGGR